MELLCREQQATALSLNFRPEIATESMPLHDNVLAENDTGLNTQKYHRKLNSHAQKGQT